MNPGVFVMGGGGAGGGGSGSGKGGSGGKQGGNGGNGGKDAKGGGKNAKGCGQGSGGGCPNPKHGGSGTAAGDPVDFTSGRVYTITSHDLVLPGPLTFIVERTYDSSRRDRDVGLGHGWMHSLAWQVHVGRRRLQLTTGQGIEWDLPLPPVDGETQIEDMLIRREHAVISVTVGSMARTYRFETAAPPQPNAPSPTGRYLLTAILDPYANGVRLSYEAGLLIGFVDSAGRLVRVRREGGRIVAFEVRSGNSWIAYRTYEHDDRGNLIAACDGYGNPVRYTYDDDHLLTSQCMPEGMTTYYRYDQRSRCIETWCERPQPDPALDADVPKVLADGTTRAKGFLHCKIEYGDDYVEVTTSRALRRYLLDGSGSIDKSVFGGAPHETRYDTLGNLIEYVDGLGAAWTWTYDAKGRKTSEMSPLGDLRTWIYDADGNLRRAEHPTGFIEYERNRQGDLSSAVDSLGLIVAYERDIRGLVTRATTPAGDTVMAYDAMGNRVLVREPNGAERKIAYDYLGQPVSMIDENGHETRYVYGAARELLAVLMPDGSRIDYTYDKNGHLVGILTPLGKYELLWGAYEVVHEVRTPDGANARFRYDRECALVCVINEAGDEHVITRDIEGRVTKEKTFDGRTTSYRVDALGRVEQVMSHGGEVTEIAYDALGRIKERTLPDGTVEAFTYDWISRVLTSDNGIVRCTLDYDARGRCLRETQSYGGKTETVESTFGGVSRVFMRTSRGHAQKITPTPMGLPEEILLAGANAPVRFRWDGADNEIERVLPGGGLIHASWDPMGRLSRHTVYEPHLVPSVKPNEPEWLGRRPGLVLEQTFSYVAGTWLPWRVDDNVIGATEFAHDPMGQVLARLPQGLPPETFSYTATERVIDDGVARDYAEGGRLVRRGSTEHVYDVEGRLVEKRIGESIWRYEYNGASLLAAITRPDSTRVEHVYDCFARRVEKRTSNADGVILSRVSYVWDGDLLVHEIRDRAKASGDVVVEERTYTFTSKSRAPFAHRDVTINGSRAESGWVYYLNDATGRAQALLDERGTPLATFDTRAFGRMDPIGKARASTSARFMGHWEDEESGLFYNRYRFYDPEAARYLTPEPMGLEGGLSVYGYARNRPFDYIDPDGLAGMIASGPGAAPRGSAGTEGIPSSTVLAQPGGVGQGLHPVVQQALANPSLAKSYGQPRSPAACAEPRHLSDYLYNHQPPVDPNNPASVQAALQNYKVQASQANNGTPRAPCPNCSQMFANLMAKYGAPDPNNIAKGGTSWNSLPANYTNFQQPPAGAAGAGPGGQAYTSYQQALNQFNCLPGDALIDTPAGPIAVRDLAPGSVVYTVDRGERVARPILETCKLPAPPSHKMRYLALDDGRELWVSHKHPDAAGAPIVDLSIGDTYDGATVVAANTVPFVGGSTHDLLPAGDTGQYWANSVLIGSTLTSFRAALRVVELGL